MKYNFNSWARRMMACVICGVFAAGLSAVPAYRGWQTRTQADGTTIEVQIVGDEFYHYTVNREGKQVREINGMYVEVGEAPTVEVAKTRHKAAKARRMPKVIGTQPNLAPKGVVILANFKDSQMKSSHTQAVFDELCNSENCTVNEYNGKKYGSAAQYFADQSNGTYRPTFDVFGPVTLAKNVADYGTDLWVQDTETGEWYQDQGSDSLAANAVVEACLLANQQYTINWADYDSDSDGYVDFVYLIYAGKGQANGGADETIWPHNWNIESARYYGNCTYTKIQCKVGGKYLNNYACSGELTGNGGLSGIGTLCHEFGHVMGLPDLYDTDYGYNYENFLTPNEWDIMDGGSYNGGEHCPPNYDPWEKYFFGWTDPVNPGNEPADVTLYPNGSTNRNIYQINASGTKQKATATGLCYYLENRQQSGWDTYLPTHGMVIWKLNFNSSAWEKNEPNNSGTDGSPLYTIVCSSGTMIGDNWVYDESAEKWVQVNDGTNNAFPGKDHVTSWTDVSDKPVTEITESGNLITFKYKGGNTTYWTYGIEGKHCVVPAAGTVDKGEALNLTITADKGYTLANEECWLVEMGSDLLEYGIGFTYNEENGAFAIPSVTGNVYIVAEAKAIPVSVTWMANGVEFTKTECAGSVVLPTSEPDACGDKVFVGWCADANYKSETTAPTFVKNGDAVTEVTTFYAVYATEGTGSGNGSKTFTFSEIASANNWENGEPYTTVTIDPVTIKANGGGNNGKWYESNSSWRMYSGGKVVITVKEGTVTSVTSSPSCTWTISNGEATFSPSARTDFTEVVVNYTSSSGTSYSDYTTSCTPSAPTEYTIRFIDRGSTVSEQNVLKGQSAEKPADPIVCSNYTFVGWWTEELAEDNTEAKSWITDFTANQDQDYYAIYSKTEEGEGESKVASMTFKSSSDGSTEYKSASDILNNLISTHDGFKTCSGSKLYEGEEGAKFGNKSSNGSLSLTLLNSASITKVVVNASKYGSDTGKIKVEAGSTSLGTQSPATNLVFSTSSPIETDKITVSTTSKRAYVQSIDIYAGGSSNTTYYSSTVDCSETQTELVDMDGNLSAAKKILRNGQIVIIRGEAVYTLTGQRIQ